MRPRRALVAAVVVAVVAAACGGSDAESTTTTASAAASTTTPTTTGAPATPAPAKGCADVVEVTIDATTSGFTVSATVRSADTGWEKYADLWEVRSPDGAVLGERVLAHPHVEEQPFTRSLSGVAIPDGVDEVTVAARDSIAGFCGAEYAVEVPGR